MRVACVHQSHTVALCVSGSCGWRGDPGCGACAGLITTSLTLCDARPSWAWKEAITRVDGLEVRHRVIYCTMR